MTRNNAPQDVDAVVLSYLDDAYNLARWLVGSPADAQDVVQEAVLRALRYFPSFRGTNARAWFLQIVRNAAYAALNRTRETLHVPIADQPGSSTEDEWAIEQLIDPGEDAEALLARVQQRRQLDALLASLPAELRECIVLRELEGLSYKEIAEITDTPIGTVMSRLWRARRSLVRFAAESGGQ